MVNVLDWDIVNEFKIQSDYYIYFWINIFGKGVNYLILDSNGLNHTTAVLLERWLCNCR